MFTTVVGIIVAFLIFGQVTDYVTRIQPLQQTATLDTDAKNLIIYHQAAVAFAHTQPSFTGAISDASLTLPAGYRKAATWSSAVTGGVVATHPADGLPSRAPGAFIASLLRASPNDFGVGFAEHDHFASSAVSGSTLAINVALPDGTPLYISPLN